jgi:hypothetical protein
MSSSNSVNGNVPNSLAASAAKNPMVAGMKSANNESMDFMLWTAAQATSLSKLKVFHTMAKQINDQQ